MCLVRPVAAIIIVVVTNSILLLTSASRVTGKSPPPNSIIPLMPTPLPDKLEEWQQIFDQQELVAMSVFGSSRYGLDKAGKDDWNNLIPSRGGHVVKFFDPESPPESNYTTYTVAMLHQLKCLEIYHREYIQDPPPPPSPHVRHCLNYLRQQVLCRMNLKLESSKDNHARSTREYETVCRDWSLVYKAVEENQKMWEENT